MEFMVTGLLYGLFGMIIGIILLLFTAWIDSQFMEGRGVKTCKSKFKTYLVAACYELIFFLMGVLAGLWILT